MHWLTDDSVQDNIMTVVCWCNLLTVLERVQLNYMEVV